MNYPDAYAAAAWAVAGHGLAEVEHGNAMEGEWMALVIVSPHLLESLNEPEVAAWLRRTLDAEQRIVWIAANEHGVIRTVLHDAADRQDVVTRMFEVATTRDDPPSDQQG